MRVIDAVKETIADVSGVRPSSDYRVLVAFDWSGVWSYCSGQPGSTHS